MEEETGGVDLGSSQSFAGTPSPPSWTKLTVDIRTGTNASDASGTTHAGGAPVVSLSEEERRRKRPLRRRAEESPYVLSNFGGSSAKTNTWPTEVVISSVIGYALVRLEAHKDKITAAMLDKPLSATDLLELSELKEILDAELKTSGRVPSITMRKEARATVSFMSSPLASSSSGIRQSVRAPPPNTNAFALDPTKLTECEPQVLLHLIREYCRVHIRLFPENVRQALVACLEIPFTNFRLNAMHSLIYSLPSGNRTMLQYLVSFLASVLKKSEENGVTAESLALIFGPSLLHSSEDKELEIEQGIAILRGMLDHYDRLFVLNKDMTWKNDGDSSLMAIARIEQIIEAAVDPNYPEEEIVDILFLTYDYYITSRRLLDQFIELYERPQDLGECAMTIHESVVRILDYWVHCYPACFDSAHEFLDRLTEFIRRISLDKASEALRETLGAISRLIDEKNAARQEEGDSSNEKGLQASGKRRVSTLGNHRASLKQGKLSSALRVLRKSGSEKKEKRNKRKQSKDDQPGSSLQDTPAKEKSKAKKGKKGKDGTAIMFEGLEIGYKKMVRDEPAIRNRDSASERIEPQKERTTVPPENAVQSESDDNSTGLESQPGRERTAPLERSITVSSRTLYTMMGNGFKQMSTVSGENLLSSSPPTHTQTESNGSVELDSKQKAKSKKADKADSSKRSKQKSAEKKETGSTHAKHSEVNGTAANEGSSDAAVISPEGGSSARSLEESPRAKRKAKKSRAHLDATTLSSSGSRITRERSIRNERERRGSFMTRTLSLSGSFATAHRSVKEEKDERKEWRGTVHLASAQSWAALTAVPVHSAKEDINFLTADPGHIARQLTLLDWELFASISCNELLKSRFMKAEESPSFAAMVNRFNRTGQWVCATMLQYDLLMDRTKAIEQFIKIGVECHKIHNFNTLFAIMGGLNTTAISRLKTSWDKLPKKVARQYKELMEIASTDANFWNYRSVLKKTPLPLIPYLAICTQDIFKVEEKQTFFNGMIYFEKMRLLWRFHSSFRKWQSASYPFGVDRGMRAFLNDFTPLSEKEMYDRSYKLEPRSS